VTAPGADCGRCRATASGAYRRARYRSGMERPRIVAIAERVERDFGRPGLVAALAALAGSELQRLLLLAAPARGVHDGAEATRRGERDGVEPVRRCVASSRRSSSA
jgi:hypothetical protein